MIVIILRLFTFGRLKYIWDWQYRYDNIRIFHSMQLFTVQSISDNCRKRFNTKDSCNCRNAFLKYKSQLILIMLRFLLLKILQLNLSLLIPIIAQEFPVWNGVKNEFISATKNPCNENWLNFGAEQLGLFVIPKKWVSPSVKRWYYKPRGNIYCTTRSLTVHTLQWAQSRQGQGGIFGGEAGEFWTV